MNQLVKTDNKIISLWENDEKLKEIRKLFASNLTDLEFEFLCGIGQSTGLNPFLREIWSVKYDKSRPAQIFIGRDGYRKAAQSHSDYDYHQSDAVYSNDKFQVINGEIIHEYTLKNRGDLIGAYCIVKRHKSTRPIYVFVDKDEYSTGRSLWNEKDGKPATMIKKVAESQALRAAFQDLLGGTYGEEEYQKTFDSESENVIVINKQSGTECLKDILKKRTGELNNENIIEINSEYEDSQNSQETIKNNNNESMAEIGEEESKISNSITDYQLDLISSLIFKNGLSDERLKKAFEYYKVDNLEQLTESQANDFYTQLRKI